MIFAYALGALVTLICGGLGASAANSPALKPLSAVIAMLLAAALSWAATHADVHIAHH